MKNRNKLLPCLVWLLLFGSCSLEDTRDECCGNLIMKYSYQPYEMEAFETNIHSLRHFLFDASGGYIGEMPSGTTLTRQSLNLDAGDYTMVTVGNLSEKTCCEPALVGGLDSLKLFVAQQFEQQPDCHSNSDELYWGVKDFSVDETKRNEYITYMSNIHCRLEIRVFWYNIPPYIGDYVIELKSVPVGYTLNPEHSHSVNGFSMPDTTGRVGSYRLRVPLLSQELYGRFITLRYGEGLIPVFRLWYEDKAITQEIDLARAFRSWGWFPERAHVQAYRIQIQLFSNGKVEVSPWSDVSIEDWVNGGTFG